jgi:hypothetical protein
MSLPHSDTLFEGLNDISTEMGFGYLEKKELKKILERIHIDRLGFSSNLSISIKNTVKNELKNIENSPESHLKNSISKLENKLNFVLKDKVISNSELRATIIYEIIMSDIENEQ